MRRRGGWQWSAAAMVAAAVTTATTVADATVAVRLTRAEQVNLSDLVVRATVVGHTSGWNADHSQMLTLTRLRVTEVYKGTAVFGGELVVRQFGGEVDGMVMHIPGDPQLRDGADVVTFLRVGQGVAFFTAMSQSVYFVTPGVSGPVSVPGSVTTGTTSAAPNLQVWRDLSGITFAVPSRNGPMQMVEPSEEPAESLQHLATEVRALGGTAR